MSRRGSRSRAPEAISYIFNEEGKCTCFTGGYQMDRRVGNTKKLGALFGILAAIGAPVPGPGSADLSRVCAALAAGPSPHALRQRMFAAVLLLQLLLTLLKVGFSKRCDCHAR